MKALFDTDSSYTVLDCSSLHMLSVCKMNFLSLFNPLSPNSDRQQFSPNDVHTLSRDKVMRISKMITKEKMP